MIGLESLRWVLTLAFAATSGYHLVRCLRPAILPEPVGEHWVSEMFHLTMGVSMTAMIWPWGSVVPDFVWVGLFTVSAGWFAARALWSVGRRLVLGFFATAMATMVWMGVAMPAHAAPMQMAGMSMEHGSAGVTGWVSGVLGAYLVLAAFWWFFGGLRLGSLATAHVHAGHSHASHSHAGHGDHSRTLSWASMCHGLMSIGMGLALLTMI